MGYSIERRNDRDFTETHSRCGTRKTYKNQAGDHRQPKHAHHDLEHSDQMPIKSFRIHVAVANGRQSFHAKEKGIEKRAGPHLGDGVCFQHVQRSKYNIDKEVDAENKTGEARPAQRQNQMVRISPIELLGIELNKFELPGPDSDLARPSPHFGISRLFHCDITPPPYYSPTILLPHHITPPPYYSPTILLPHHIT